MPSALAKGRARATHDDIDNYGVDDFSDEDPFRSPTPPDASKKRKEREDVVNIDEEISVQKRVRLPNVKLDEDRLLSAAGIPTLRTRAKDLKIKGKGHEFSDAARLLSFYQLWLDDLFPKAKFKDALVMVEKAGHKRRLVAARSEWISEGRRRDNEGAADEETQDVFEPAQNNTTSAATTTADRVTPEAMPVNGHVSNNDDLYGATPRANRAAPRPQPQNDVPEDDDLAALMAEAETHDQRPEPPRLVSRPAAEPEEDDLEALMAEAETHDKVTEESTADARDGSANSNAFADEEAAMREMDDMW